EFLGVDGGGSLHVPRKYHRTRSGDKRILVFCVDFYFLFVRESGRTDSGNRNNRVGSLRRFGKFPCRSAIATRWQRGSEPDDRNVGRILRDVVCLGDSGQRLRRILERIVWPKR